MPTLYKCNNAVIASVCSRQYCIIPILTEVNIITVLSNCNRNKVYIFKIFTSIFWLFFLTVDAVALVVFRFSKICYLQYTGKSSIYHGLAIAMVKCSHFFTQDYWRQYPNRAPWELSFVPKRNQWLTVSFCLFGMKLESFTSAKVLLPFCENWKFSKIPNNQHHRMGYRVQDSSQLLKKRDKYQVRRTISFKTLS